MCVWLVAGGDLPSSLFNPVFQRRTFGGSGHWDKYGVTVTDFKSKVAVIGTGGGIGQMVSLLLKASNRVRELALYDNFGLIEGIVKDLEDVYDLTTISSHEGKKGIEDALDDASIVVVTAGLPMHTADKNHLTKVSFSVIVVFLPFCYSYTWFCFINFFLLFTIVRTCILLCLLRRLIVL